ncbi:MAG: cupin domain-containing protein [Actinomycetota bacterium]|nr:cupin domain-containing protein [Actinomycetota bacterium]
MEKRPKIANIEDATEDVWSEGRFASRTKDLGRAAGSERLGLRKEVISPGRQSAPEHAHYAEEEMFIVLGGRGSLLHGGERVPVREGDVVSYPSGVGVSHAFVADEDEELEILSIGERNPNDVVTYPRSGKVLIKPLGKVGRLREADYFGGEA